MTSGPRSRGKLTWTHRGQPRRRQRVRLLRSRTHGGPAESRRTHARAAGASPAVARVQLDEQVQRRRALPPLCRHGPAAARIQARTAPGQGRVARAGAEETEEESIVAGGSVSGTPPFRRRWWTCIRFCMLVLGSGHAYGVMLNDDVTVADDFERTLEAHLLRFSEPMKFATYRLGQFDLGLVVSRESAARQLGIICELETLDHFHDHFTSRTHRWLPHVVGNCPITYAGRPLEGLARPHGALHAKSNILGVANEASDAEFLARIRNRPRDRPGFCGSAYPGRIFNRSHLGAWIHADPALRPANAPLGGPQGTVARPAAPDLRAAATHALLAELANRVEGPGGGTG